MPEMTQVLCTSAPGVHSHSWWMEGFLTLILLILELILVLGQNLRLSVVLMKNVFFPIFLCQMPKVIRRQMDPPRLPPPQYDRHRKESSVHGRRKISNRAANSEFFTKNLVWKLSMTLLRSWITKMISGMPVIDPSTFKRQLILIFFETFVRRFFLPRRRRLSECFRL